MLTTFKPEVSAVVATYNRPESCVLCVNSMLEAFNGAPTTAEIIIGINGTDSETLESLQKLSKQKKNVSLRILPFSSRENPSGFRNRLLNEAKGEWVYFIDDDAFVDPDFFLKFIQVRNANQNVSVIGGPNLTPPKSNFFQRATGVTLASRFATYFSSARYIAEEPSKLCGEESLILCNLFIRKDSLWAEPFLSKLICCEESWLLLEMEAKGSQLLYESSLHVWHDRRSHLFSLMRQVYKYGFGRGQVLKMSPTRLRPAHVLPSICVGYTLIIGSLFILNRPPKLVWMTPYLLYLFFCVAAGLASARRSGYNPPGWTGAVSSFLFPVIHVCYGIGLFWGLVRG